jgi:hypothetical protein
MSSFGLSIRRAGSIAAAVALMFATAIPALASAAQITERSIELSTSTADADGVSYSVAFTAVGAAGSILLDFCSDSPLTGAECTAPGGFSASGAATATSGYTIANAGASTIRVTSTVDADEDVAFTLTGINNPTAAGPLYVRILTFVDDTAASSYADETPGSYIDNGGVALSITNKIGVSAAVLETMTFCVSGQTITENCVGSGAAAPNLTAPVLQLGADNGGVIALDSSNVYTGDVYTQISTNAAAGAVVNLKSSAAGCGGLLRAGAPTPAEGCGIAPALATDITQGQAKFGVRTATAAGAGSNFNGVFQPYGTLATTPYYSSSVYKMNYVSGDATGVTSTYGDPFLETAGAPANNMGMTLTFGASAANNTPAGLYSADLSLIATGKF